MADTPIAPADSRLDAALTAVDDRLRALGDALRARDAAAIELQASELHRALSAVVDQFARAAKSGPIAPALRQRLARTGGLVAAQRESLSRATAALDRAMDVLTPRDAVTVHSPQGSTERGLCGGAIQA
ncbi:hypothetical protein [uncultured Piscinibacter sp.]|uniref:hypothetical protein n=1 Tax=uncultured Piscinibacter sp. TaxID=1131835 RepID=UPI0026292960|nr:hypothetical protein [uncultured Piscinibacter sp.]